MPIVTKKDIEELDKGLAELEAADVDPAFKRKAVAIYAESKALAIDMMPFFLRADELDKRITELKEIYPALSKYI